MGAQDLPDDVVDDLDAWLADLAEPDMVADEPPPPPEDQDQAERMLRRVARFGRQIDQFTAVAEAQRKRIGEWLEDRVAGASRQRQFHEATLEGWMRAQHARNERLLTVNLPSGALRLRAAVTKVLVTQEDAFTETFAVTRPEWVHTKLTVDKKRLAADTVPGELATLAGEPAPDGYEYREVMGVAGWTFLVLPSTGPCPPVILVPRMATVPGVLFMIPTRRSFSLTTTPKESR